MKLVIVESPTKAKTISRFLGKDFKIKSSFGHIRDLPAKELGVDIENNFTPKYIIPSKALARVRELKKMAKEAEKVILATDEDREGEAISWHLLSALGLKETSSERITFHEITKQAIEKALKNPRTIDTHLVDAQQARRILDRLIGYKLSPFVAKKVRKGLSAGRVQSVAVRLIAEKEKAIKTFQPQEYWEIEASFQQQTAHEASATNFIGKLWKYNQKLLDKYYVKNQTEAETIKSFLEKSNFAIKSIVKKQTKKTPPPPFTTSTLQQIAGSAFGFSPKRTMQIAQQLYEGIALENNQALGLITYMRTDSTNLSLESVIAAKKKIEEMFGKKYALETHRIYKTKSKNAQEAHEAIRPTFPDKDPEEVKPFLTTEQYKLYKLIWSRMIASQMAAAIFDSTTVEILAQENQQPESYSLKTKGSIIVFDGYLKLTNTTHTEDILLPELQESEPLNLLNIKTEQKFTQPPSRYSEASLVKALEENGIGRPSTYAPTITTIQDRGYVQKDEQKKLFPTEVGLLVNDLLVEHFSQIVDYKFTAQMEKNLDDVAIGKKNWVGIVSDFYLPFAKNLKEKSSQIQKVQTSIGRACPECGADLVERYGKFGKFIACSNYPNCKYTEKSEEEKKEEQQIKASSGASQDNIICDKCGAPMTLKKGPYGSFLGCSRYPECKNIKKIETKTGVFCPLCGKDIIERKSKKGRLFYGCSGYPNCKFVLWSKPTGEKCPQCKSLLVYGPKNTIKCSNQECAYKKEAL
jgi:DNA topoisomerase-1